MHGVSTWLHPTPVQPKRHAQLGAPPERGRNAPPGWFVARALV